MQRFIEPVNIEELMAALGGPSEISRKYKLHLNKDVSVKTIQKWRERNSISAKRLMELQELGEYEGIIHE